MVIAAKDLIEGTRNFVNRVMVARNDPSQIQSLCEDMKRNLDSATAELSAGATVDMKVGARQPNDPPGFQRIFESVPEPQAGQQVNPETGKVTVDQPISNQIKDLQQLEQQTAENQKQMKEAEDKKSNPSEIQKKMENTQAMPEQPKQQAFVGPTINQAPNTPTGIQPPAPNQPVQTQQPR